MTTSLRAISRCVGVSGAVSVRNQLFPAVESGRLVVRRPGLGTLGANVSLLRVMRYLEWQWCGGGNYLKAPVPAEMRGPAREEAQIMISGVARRITLFMGKSDWELDWHIHPILDPSVVTRLEQVGKLRGTLFCEWMAVNRWESEVVGRQWWSADMDGMLSLRWPLDDEHPGAETASDYWSWEENDHQGGSAEVVADVDDSATRGNSAVVGGRVYLQGAFVTDDPIDDDEHNHLEIHPLDSVAYAKELDGTVLAVRPTEAGWPQLSVRWRVGVVTNAGFHRINGCSFVTKERRTIWYLALPSAAALPDVGVTVTQRMPGFWHAPSNQRFEQRRVKSVTIDPPPDGRARSYEAFPVDPADGRHKLKLDVTMETPDDWGGLFLREFTITARSVVAE
jgi:hypothetical protein